MKKLVNNFEFQYIFTFLPSIYSVRASRCSKVFCTSLNEEGLWESLTKRDFIKSKAFKAQESSPAKANQSWKVFYFQLLEDASKRIMKKVYYESDTNIVDPSYGMGHHTHKLQFNDDGSCTLDYDHYEMSYLSSSDSAHLNCSGRYRIFLSERALFKVEVGKFAVVKGSGNDSRQETERVEKRSWTFLVKDEHSIESGKLKFFDKETCQIRFAEEKREGERKQMIREQQDELERIKKANETDEEKKIRMEKERKDEEAESKRRIAILRELYNNNNQNHGSQGKRKKKRKKRKKKRGKGQRGRGK